MKAETTKVKPQKAAVSARYTKKRLHTLWPWSVLCFGLAAAVPVAPTWAAEKTDKKQQADTPSTDDDTMPTSIANLVVHGERNKNATTDGTGSYVVKAVSMNKMLLRLDEIPQSVSVLGRQQMHDQNLNTVDDALKQVPGVSVNLYGDGTAGYMARGHILSPQFDGVAPSGGFGLTQQFDIAVYDRLGVSPGPDGQF